MSYRPRITDGCMLTRSTNQSIPSGAFTPLEFDAAQYNSGTLWVIGAPSRITIVRPGRYAVGGGGVYFAGALGGGSCAGLLLLNGTIVEPYLGCSNSEVNGGFSTHFPIAGQRHFDANDYIEFTTYHAAGVNKDVAEISFYAHLLAAD